MEIRVEHEWEIQEQLKKEGFKILAPSNGCYRKINDAMEMANKLETQYNDVIVVNHKYCGMGNGYFVMGRDMN
jgi:hypothetical protein